MGGEDHEPAKFDLFNKRGPRARFRMAAVRGYEADNLQVTRPSCNKFKGDNVMLKDLIPQLERKAGELGF